MAISIDIHLNISRVTQDFNNFTDLSDLLWTVDESRERVVEHERTWLV